MFPLRSRTSFWGGRHWCGRACKSAATKPLAACTQCGTQHRRYRRLPQSGHSFCSLKCCHEFKRSCGQNRVCDHCGNNIWCSRKKSKQKLAFCGNACLYAFRGANRDTTTKVHKKPKGIVARRKSIYGEWDPTWKRLSKTVGKNPRDSWTAKLDAIRSGWSKRARDIRRPRQFRNRVSVSDWSSALDAAVAAAKRKLRRFAKKAKNPWWVKIETMSRKWNQRRLLMEWIENESC